MSAITYSRFGDGSRGVCTEDLEIILEWWEGLGIYGLHKSKIYLYSARIESKAEMLDAVGRRL